METRKATSAVRRYLEALDNHRPKRGRKRTADSVRKRLDNVEQQIATAPAMQRLRLIQERLDLQAELQTMKDASDLGKLEAEFIKAAKTYSEAKGITYTAWRELGITADVLRKAGVPRTRRGSR